MRNGIEDQALVAGALLETPLRDTPMTWWPASRSWLRMASPIPPESPMTANVPCSVPAIVHQFGDFILNLGRLGHEGI